jgi:hydrophobe/amphiphile efflux-1 (HAE1) family protein
MNWNFSAWSIRQPVPSIVLFVVLCFLGIMSFRNLPVTRFPNIDVPVVSVTVTQAGAAPAELETQVTKRVEDAVAGVTGIRHMISTVTDGTSTTAIEFRLEINSDRALNDVKDAVAKIRADLPRSIDEPVIQRVDVEGQSIQTYAASAPHMTLEQLSWYVDDVAKRGLQGLKGVGRVERYGGVDREIRIHLDPDRLMALGVTAGDVNRQLRLTNVDVGGGRGEIGGQEQAIRTLAGSRSVRDLTETKIVIPGGREVRLGDLGRIEDAAGEQRFFATRDGQPIVAIAVFRAKGASDVDVAAAVKRKIAELERGTEGVAFSLIDDPVSYTYGNYQTAMKTLLEGAALAVLVVFVFLRNWRATLIAAVALPLSAIPTFWAIDALGFSLNLVSLLAITLATGILVDDAIVEIENIARHMRMGKSPYRASMEAADEIGLAVIAITLTIVAIFAPVSFMGGIAGQYFKQFGMTVAIAVLFSLLVARLITPMMSAYLMRPIPHKEAVDGRLMRAYIRFLRMTLKHPYSTLAAGVAVFAASIWATSLLPTGFIPPADESRIIINAELPPGSTLERTRATTDRMTEIVKSHPEVGSVFVLGGVAAGAATGVAREVRNAMITVRLKPKAERALGQKQLEGKLVAALAGVPDMRMWLVNSRGERELTLSLLAADGEALSKAVASIEAELRKTPGFASVATTGAIERPEIRLVPKYAKAADAGVTPDAIAEAIRIATIGDVGPNLAKFTIDDRQIPIRVQLEEQARTDLAVLSALRVSGAGGASVPIQSVADITFARGPSVITRYDRERRAAVGADLVGGLALGEAVERFKALPAAAKLPAGVRLKETGDAEIMGEVFSGFAFAMVTGLLIVVAVLIVLFGSVFQPITILLSLPLSIGGVVLALLLTSRPISMPVVIGILMLMGIVTKNAIMLVDFAIEEARKGMPRFDAIVDAGRKRARPIIMTTIAMAGGMLPSAIGVGDGGEFRSPMAIGVIGGLLVSTVLSLVFVPSFYTVMDDLGRFFAWLLGRFVGSSEPDPVPAAAPAE